MSESAEQVIADVLECEPTVSNVQAIAAALRAAGLLPGPDDIVVSREALRQFLTLEGTTATWEARRSLAAALSQPHPAQERCCGMGGNGFSGSFHDEDCPPHPAQEQQT